MGLFCLTCLKPLTIQKALNPRMNNVMKISRVNISILDSYISTLPYIQIRIKCINRNIAIPVDSSDKKQILKFIILSIL
jgi:hypothetical protein